LSEEINAGIDNVALPRLRERSMSYFEDQYDAWMSNDCKGAIEDYDGTEQFGDEV
jgi:hypothetical protein